MNDIQIPTIEELKKRRMVSLMVSKKAIVEHLKEYQMIKQLINTIIHNPLDIGDYYKTAIRLSDLLAIMCKTGKDSIFNYYHQLIDPRQNGQARYFRVNCLDLFEQLKYVDKARTGKRKFRIIN